MKKNCNSFLKFNALRIAMLAFALLPSQLLEAKTYTSGSASSGGEFSYTTEATLTLEEDSIFNNKVLGIGPRIYYGGAIYSTKSLSLISEYDIEFNGCYVKALSGSAYGGAVAVGVVDIGSKSGLNISANNISFIGNNLGNNNSSQIGDGGAIYSQGLLTIEAKGDIYFSGNLAPKGNGGAIYSEDRVSLKALNGKITFEHNGGAGGSSSNGYGGAIYALNGLEIVVGSNLGEMISSGNGANHGGFLYAEKGTCTFDIGENSIFHIGDSQYYGGDTLASYTASFIKKGLGSIIIDSDASEWEGGLGVYEGLMQINNIFGDSESTAVTIRGGVLDLVSPTRSVLNFYTFAFDGNGALRVTNLLNNLGGKGLGSINFTSDAEIIFGNANEDFAEYTHNFALQVVYGKDSSVKITLEEGVIIGESSGFLTRSGMILFDSDASGWKGGLDIFIGSVKINNIFGDVNSTAISLNSGTLDLGNSQNSVLNFNTFTFTGGALRVTNLATNFGSKSLSDINFSAGTGKIIIFGNANEDLAEYTHNFSDQIINNTETTLEIRLEEGVIIDENSRLTSGLGMAGNILFNENASGWKGELYIPSGSVKINDIFGDANSTSISLTGGTLDLSNNYKGALNFNTFNFSGGSLRVTNLATNFGSKSLGDINFSSETDKELIFGNANKNFIEYTHNFDTSINAEKSVKITFEDNVFIGENSRLTSIGEGTLIFDSNASVWKGGLDISAGSVKINNIFGNANSTAIYLTGGTLDLGNSQNSVLNFNTFDFTEGALRVTNLATNLGSKSLSDINFSAETNKELIFGNPNTSGAYTHTLSGVNDGKQSINVSAGTLSIILENGVSLECEANTILAKEGNGRLLVNTDLSTWQGNLEVNAGTFELNGVFGMSSGIATIANNATLKGAGTLNNATTIQKGGIIAPDGTFTFGGDLALEGGSVVKIKEGDIIIVQGELFLGNTELDKILIDLSSFGDEIQGEYKIIELSVTASYTGTFEEHFAFSENFTGNIYLGEDNNVYLTNIPEPAQFAALLGLITLLFIVRAKTRSNAAQRV